MAPMQLDRRKRSSNLNRLYFVHLSEKEISMFQNSIRILGTTLVALSLIATSNARAEDRHNPLQPSYFFDNSKSGSAAATDAKPSDPRADSINSRQPAVSHEEDSGSRHATEKSSARAYSDTPLHFSIRR
jgi:hypothetical protein